MRKEFLIKTRTAHRMNRAAFTLPEMLVAVGLMLLVMSLFAEIFSLAVTAMTTQVGLAKNDQRARTAFIVIDNDLKRMSYRPIDGQQGIVPLVPGLRYKGEEAAPEQQGYIYYSENNPLDDTDDVLQFTIFGQQQNNRYPEQNLDYYGRANSLSPSGARDQPDWDDGTPGDGVSVSKQAEVVYFLRHGTLYRRTLLLRDATATPNELLAIDNDDQKKAQPATFVTVTEAGEDYDLPFDLMNGYGGNFYLDFDYSAHYGTSPYDSDLLAFLALPSSPSLPPGLSPPTNNVALFHGTLSNSTQTNNWPLGVPHFRFGFSAYKNPSNPPTISDGRPREYFASGGVDYFFGRYTHEETSNANFQYPDNNSSNVFTRNDFDLTIYQNTGRLDVFANGPRRGTDILMNNVQSFDVEIWDERASRFVDIGSTELVGQDFSTVNNLNPNYGPIKPNRVGPLASNPDEVNVFDTWHSLTTAQLTSLNATIVGTGQAPYVPKVTNPASVGTWTPGPYTVGTLVKPTTPGRINNAILYRCTIPGTAVTEPSWNTDVTVGEFVDGDGIGWQIIDNRRPIKALRIIIRFHDPNSDQMRQVTIVHSFNEDLE